MNGAPETQSITLLTEGREVKKIVFDVPFKYRQLSNNDDDIPWLAVLAICPDVILWEKRWFHRGLPGSRSNTDPMVYHECIGMVVSEITIWEEAGD